MEEIKSGIYKLVNANENKIYLGYSENLENAKNIIDSQLEKNVFHNIEVQEDYNKGNKFDFVIEKLVYPDHDLLHYERYLTFIKYENSGFYMYNNKIGLPGIFKKRDFKDFALDIFCKERFGKSFDQLFSGKIDLEEHMLTCIIRADKDEEKQIREYYEPIIRFRRDEINRERREKLKQLKNKSMGLRAW